MASDIKVNNIKSYTGNTLTLGQSGDTVTLASGATSSGFGAEYNGAVNWDTTAKTSAFTAVSGTGYFVDTSSAAITATLPASPSAGDIVAFKDYDSTFGTNNLSIARNGSNIQGQNVDSVITTDRASVVLIYVDSTQGWLYTNESNVADLADVLFVATGGTITESGDYKIHTFTSSGTFTVTRTSPTSNTIDYLVIGGGASGGVGDGGEGGGGGGAGGYRESVPSPAAWPASPIANSGGSIPVTTQGYPITIGGGGGAVSPAGTSGNNGSFSAGFGITSAGGGRGGGASPGHEGAPGGSGGGSRGAANPAAGGNGNVPSVSPPQGNPGGHAVHLAGGSGGGGAGGPGYTDNADTNYPSPANNTSPNPNAPGGNGGDGQTSSISGSAVGRAGGGGGSSHTSPPSQIGNAVDGGGNGGIQGGAGVAGTANTGGGGGGGMKDAPATSGAGGSGIVIVRYKFK